MSATVIDLEAPIVKKIAEDQAQVIAAGGDVVSHFWAENRSLLISTFGFTPAQAEETLALAAQEATTPVDGLLDLTLRLRLLVATGEVGSFWNADEANHE